MASRKMKYYPRTSRVDRHHAKVMSEAGVSLSAIARHFGVDRSTVRWAIEHYRWSA